MNNSDNLIEPRDNGVDVDKIMKQIRKNIREKKKDGNLPSDPDMFFSEFDDSNVDSDDIDRLSSLCDVTKSSYVIKSYRPYFGEILKKGRLLINGEIRRYMWPILARQYEWNRIATRLFREQKERMEVIESRINERYPDVSTGKCEHFSKFLSGSSNVLAVGNFQDCFKKQMLDVGITVNFIIPGINKFDFLSNLQKIDQDSLDGVILYRLEKSVSEKVIKLCAQKIRVNKKIIIESFMENELRLEDLLFNSGFEVIEITSPTDTEKLKTLPIDSNVSLEFIEVYNNNVTLLNKTLFKSGIILVGKRCK